MLRIAIASLLAAAPLTTGSTQSAEASPGAAPELLGWSAIRVADGTTCGVRLNGAGWCWGENQDGSVGDGTTTDRLTPYRLPGTWSSITPGTTTCGVRTDQSGWCWGAGGAVGDGTFDMRDRPVRLPSSGWTSIQSINNITCGVKADHTGWCWGENEFGQLGDGTTTSRNRPQQLPGSWLAIQPDALDTCGVQTDHTGWCWGFDTNGEIGNGQDTGDFQTTPFQLPGRWLSIEPTTYDTCGVQTDDTGWCWGDNYHGQIGDGTRTDRWTPTQVPGSWSSIQDTYYQGRGGRGRNSTCGVRTDGSGWCWGANDDGELGTGDTLERKVPTRLPGSWRTILQQGLFSNSVGSLTCGIQDDGSGWCWGEGKFGALGNGTTVDQLSPVPFGLAAATLSVDGNRNVCATTSDGAAYCWGDNGSGTVGDATTQRRVRPRRVLSNRA